MVWDSGGMTTGTELLAAARVAEPVELAARFGRGTARVQWDPERTLTGDPLPYRSLQVGIAGPLVARYVDEWIVGLADLTDQLPAIRAGQAPLPAERPYPLPAEIAGRLGADA